MENRNDAVLDRILLQTEGTEPAPSPTVPLASAEDGSQWLVRHFDSARPGGIVLAVRGGQSGIGPFIIYVNGEALVVNPTNRAENHCVPLMNGMWQVPGGELICTDLSPSGDCVTMDLTETYPLDSDIEYLRRRFCLVRMEPSGQVILRDDFRFRSGPGTCESRIHTRAKVEQVAPGCLLLRGTMANATLRFDPGLIKLEIEELGADEMGGMLRRLSFSIRGRKDSLILRFVPES